MRTQSKDSVASVVEKRSEERLRVSMPAWIDRGDGNQISVVTKDISQSGVRIADLPTGWRGYTGEIVRLNLQLPGATSVVHFTAVIAWRDGEQAGLRFCTTRLTPDQLHGLLAG